MSCDEKFVRMSGYPSREDISGHPLSDFIPAFQMAGELDGAMVRYQMERDE